MLLSSFAIVILFSFQSFYHQKRSEFFGRKMNSSMIFIFCISLWCHFYVANVQSAHNQALIYDVNGEKIMEIDKTEGPIKCDHCITACAASSDSEEQKRINEDAAIDKNAVFLHEVYKNNIEQKFDDLESESGDTKTISCQEPLTPAIFWDSKFLNFEIGYEIFYDPNKVELTCPPYDNNSMRPVIKGNPSIELKKIPDRNNKYLKVYYNYKQTHLLFQLLFGSKKTLDYGWIKVLTVRIDRDQNRRKISFLGDSFNDMYHDKPTLSHCKTYFFGGAWQTEDDRLSKTNQNDASMNEQVDGKTTTQLSDDSIENHLVKTQILPMKMFHSYSARLATCMYINIAYIWKNAANGPLKKVDSLLYAMYRLWPNELQIRFAVQGQNNDSSDTIASESEFFLKYPIPQLIYRVVQWSHGDYRYKAVFIIHNQRGPVSIDDRICTNPIRSWDSLLGTDDTTKWSCYVCPASEETLVKLELFENAANPLDLEKFPNFDVIHSDVTQKIRDKLDLYKNEVWESI